MNKFLGVSTGGAILKKDYPDERPMSVLEDALYKRRKRKKKKLLGADDEELSVTTGL